MAQNALPANPTAFRKLLQRTGAARHLKPVHDLTQPAALHHSAVCQPTHSDQQTISDEVAKATADQTGTTVSTPSEPADCGRPSSAAQMRVRLAKMRLRELREMDFERTQPAELFLTANRVGNALDDMIELATATWPDEDAWAEPTSPLE